MFSKACSKHSDILNIELLLKKEGEEGEQRYMFGVKHHLDTQPLMCGIPWNADLEEWSCAPLFLLRAC